MKQEVLAYIAVVWLSIFFYISNYQTLYSRYEAFQAIGAIPAFSTEGKVGNTNCDNAFVCGHLQCQTSQNYTSINHSSMCDNTRNGMISRLDLSSVIQGLSIIKYMIIVYATLGILTNITVVIVLLLSSKVPSSLNGVSVSIIVFMDLCISSYIIYTAVNITNLRPYLPNYYEASDDYYMIQQIATVCTRAVITIGISTFIASTISKNLEIEMMFRREENYNEKNSLTDTDSEVANYTSSIVSNYNGGMQRESREINLVAEDSSEFYPIGKWIEVKVHYNTPILTGEEDSSMSTERDDLSDVSRMIANTYKY